ncbi:hypothetical protein [Streptomyces rimosus]
MNVGLLLHGAKAGEAERGQVLAVPGSIAAHAVFAADIALLEESQAFAFRHHGRAAGSGTVTRLLRQFPGVSR